MLISQLSLTFQIVYILNSLVASNITSMISSLKFSRWKSQGQNRLWCLCEYRLLYTTLCFSAILRMMSDIMYHVDDFIKINFWHQAVNKLESTKQTFFGGEWVCNIAMPIRIWTLQCWPSNSLGTKNYEQEFHLILSSLQNVKRETSV